MDCVLSASNFGGHFVNIQFDDISRVRASAGNECRASRCCSE